jgi:Tfp pilus assembly protein PilV
MPKPSIAQPPFVMIRTFSARLRARGRSLTGVLAGGRRLEPEPQTFARAGESQPSTSARAGSRLARLRPTRAQLASARGDTLLEVLVSALLLGLIVVGTFSGLNSANRATSIDRARSQADALAEQNEEQLHSLSVTALKKLEAKAEEKTVKQNGTEYIVISEANLVLDNTATTSCSSTALSAEYIRTTSTVYPKSKGAFGNGAFGATKPVVETGIVSPPPDTSLVVEVTNQLANPVAGMEVQVAGPQSATAVTNTNGCAILALEPGEYEINVHLPTYVDPNWITESKNDTSTYPLHIYLPAQTTTKKAYRFALAAGIKSLTFKYLNPTTGASETTKALNATLENTQMAPTTRLVEHEGNATYLSTMHTEKIVYPFEASYTVYAGSCSANKPSKPTTVIFSPGLEKEVTLTLPALIVDVWTGTEKLPGALVKTAPEVFLSDTDEGCENTYRQQETIAPVKAGALKYPGQPWGTYTVCANVPFKNETTKKIEKKHIEAPGQKNTNTAKEGTVVNLYEGGSTGEGLKPAIGEESCP